MEPIDVKPIEAPKEQRKLMIATPMYGGMCTGHFLVGVLTAINALQRIGVPTYFTQIGNESLITRGRNELVRIFLSKPELTHLMFIDADIHFEGQDLVTLINADKDIACGIYPKKEVDWAKVEQAAKEGKTGLQDYAGAFVLNFAAEQGEVIETDETGMVEVRHGGTGFMMIKRGVFEKLAPHVPEYRTSTQKVNGEYVKPLTSEFFGLSIDDSGCMLSEDYHFCELWRKHGGKVHANPFIKLQHVGTYIFGGDIIKAGGNLK
jgi:hypothetical protein